MTASSRRLWWASAGVYAGVLLWSSLANIDPEVGVPHLDKAIHLCEYLLFAWLLMQAIRTLELPELELEAAKVWTREYRIWVWIFAFSYGCLMELLQIFVPWRSPDWIDAGMNGLGAALGVWLGDHWPWVRRDLT